jgi:hypothetical protein
MSAGDREAVRRFGLLPRSFGFVRSISKMAPVAGDQRRRAACAEIAATRLRRHRG